MKKGLKLSKTDFEELEKEKKWILEERANFSKRYAEWLKKKGEKRLKGIGTGSQESRKTPKDA